MGGEVYVTLGLPMLSDCRLYFKKLKLMLTPGFMGTMSRATLELIMQILYSQ